MDRGDGPKRAYAGLLSRLAVGQTVFEREIDRLPEPDTFRDAVFLSSVGSWSPHDLDASDALLVALVRSLWSARK